MEIHKKHAVECGSCNSATNRVLCQPCYMDLEESTKHFASFHIWFSSNGQEHLILHSYGEIPWR